MSHHIGRSWGGPGHLEALCPCPLAPCGLVDRDNLDPECQQHPVGRMKTIRTGHAAEDCPGFGVSLTEAIGDTELARIAVLDVAASEDADHGDFLDALDAFRAAVEHEAAERIRHWEREAQTLLPLERGAARGAANLIDPEATE
ncbi:hypothetical protein ACFWFX_18680 [Streptomyces roseolus]|uniref:hypothetical protein n=1 Tax=Streptomyces roseolus TaxID=67358 RepID=UPI00364DA0BA